MFKLTRSIPRAVERELWARSAGRCQFRGCPSLLYISSVTKETVNCSQKAHIYSFSESGPRGWGPFKYNTSSINDISNLMLMCHGCHKKIDQEGGSDRYPASLLIKWKAEQEEKVRIVTGIDTNNKSNVVLYGANIGSEKSPIEYHQCVEAMFPSWYPAHEVPKILSMQSVLRDSTPQYWQAESAHLTEAFHRYIDTAMAYEDCKHFSVFAFAPQPLLIKLGSLFTDKIPVETYQLHREPKTWRWQEGQEPLEYVVNRPSQKRGKPCLVISLSGHISTDRITSVLGENVSIWELTVANPSNRLIRSKSHLWRFRQVVAEILVEIGAVHGREPLSIFSAMPVSCSVELGRARMPKADMNWVLFDECGVRQSFVKTITIGRD